MKPLNAAHACSTALLPSARGHELKRRGRKTESIIDTLPSARGHELKHRARFTRSAREEVALRARARIETSAIIRPKTGVRLPSARGHELKHALPLLCVARLWLPSARGHELKLSPAGGGGDGGALPSARGHELKLGRSVFAHRAAFVALRARARIETTAKCLTSGTFRVALRARARIETSSGSHTHLEAFGCPPREGTN